MSGQSRPGLAPSFGLAVGAVVVVAVAAVVCVAGGRIHAGLLTQANDLGNQLEALASIAEGDLAMPQSNTIDGAPRPRLAVHANWILYPLGAAYALHPSPQFPFVVAAFAFAFAAMASWAHARQHGIVVAPLAGVAVLASPWMHDAVLSDGHLTTLAAACLAVGLWQRTRGVGLVAFALAALCKEDMPFVVVACGLVLVGGGERRGGVGVMGIGGVVGLMNPIVMRLAGGPSATDRFDWLLDASWGDLVTHLLDPAIARLPVVVAVVGAVAVGRRLWLLVPVLPVVALCCLDGGGYMTRLAGGYYFPVIVVVVVAGAVEVGDVRRVVAVAVVCVAHGLLASPIPAALAVAPQDAIVADARALADGVPLDLRLCVQNQLGPQLDPVRPKIALPRCGPDDAQLIMLRAVAPADNGLILRFDTTSLIGEHPLALLGRLERARRSGADLTRTPQGLYVITPHTSPRPTDLAVGDAIIDADIARFFEELGARRVISGPWVDLAVGPTRRRTSGGP